MRAGQGTPGRGGAGGHPGGPGASLGQDSRSVGCREGAGPNSWRASRETEGCGLSLCDNRRGSAQTRDKAGPGTWPGTAEALGKEGATPAGEGCAEQPWGGWAGQAALRREMLSQLGDFSQLLTRFSSRNKARSPACRPHSARRVRAWKPSLTPSLAGGQGTLPGAAFAPSLPVA